MAVKLLLPAAASLPEASARFVREARAAVAIQSEHVARVLDVGTLETGAPYMVMEHLAGEDLGKLIKARGPLPIDVAVDFVLQAGEAIAEAHALGIIHRDLKPGNLFLTRRPDGSPLVKVLDFGLSTAASALGPGPSEASLTATGFVMGSVFYMSREQFRGLKHAGARADLWALGVILYELIAGRRPFEGDSFGAVCASVIADAPAPLRAHRPDVPPGLDAVILGCLQKDPERRVQTVAELARGLAPFASSRASLSVESILRVSPEVTASARTSTSTAAAFAASVRVEPSTPRVGEPVAGRGVAAPARGRSVAILLAIAGVVTVLLLAVGVATVLRTGRGSEQLAEGAPSAVGSAAPASVPIVEALAAPAATEVAAPAVVPAPASTSAVAPAATAPGTPGSATPTAAAPKPTAAVPKPAAAKPVASPLPLQTAAPAAPPPRPAPPPPAARPKPTFTPAFEVPEEN